MRWQRTVESGVVHATRKRSPLFFRIACNGKRGACDLVSSVPRALPLRPLCQRGETRDGCTVELEPTCSDSLYPVAATSTVASRVGFDSCGMTALTCLGALSAAAGFGGQGFAAAQWAAPMCTWWSARGRIWLFSLFLRRVHTDAPRSSLNWTDPSQLLPRLTWPYPMGGDVQENSLARPLTALTWSQFILQGANSHQFCF